MKSVARSVPTNLVSSRAVHFLHFVIPLLSRQTRDDRRSFVSWRAGNNHRVASASNFVRQRRILIRIPGQRLEKKSLMGTQAVEDNGGMRRQRWDMRYYSSIGVETFCPCKWNIFSSWTSRGARVQFHALSSADSLGDSPPRISGIISTIRGLTDLATGPIL